MKKICDDDKQLILRLAEEYEIERVQMHAARAHIYYLKRKYMHAENANERRELRKQINATGLKYEQHKNASKKIRPSEICEKFELGSSYVANLVESAVAENYRYDRNPNAGEQQ